MLFILPSLTVAKDVFNNNQVIAASDAFSNVTGNVFLGRPWGGEWFFQLSIATLTDKYAYKTTQSKSHHINRSLSLTIMLRVVFLNTYIGSQV